MHRPLRCGIIGCGVIGPAHAESYRRLDNVEIAWACDLVPAKAQRLSQKFGAANVTTDYLQVLEDRSVDCISVCTDHASHVPITIAALGAGKHVLCEKALAASQQGLDSMFAAHAGKSDLVFSGVFQHRFDAAYRRLKQWVADGAFGTILTAGVQVRCFRGDRYYQADPWRGTWEKEGGAVLINQAIHFVDSLAWIMGGIEAVCGQHRNFTHGQTMETEDTAVAAVRFRQGAIGTIEATCSSNINWEPTLSIHGSKGSIDMRHGKCLRIDFADKELEARIVAELAACRDAAAVGAAKSYYGPSHPSQVADFVAAIREGRQPFVPASSARHTVEVVLGIYRSQQTGCWVELPERGD